MGLINATEFKGLYTKAVLNVYKENPIVMGFFRSFFQTKTSDELEVSIEVQRSNEKVAVDVLRGTGGRRNEFTKSTEKIFVPPMYDEYFDITSLKRYRRSFTSSGIADMNGRMVDAILQEAGEKTQELIKKIQRAEELQCAQVFDTGIVELKNGTNIDFKRRSEMLEDKSGTPWTSNANDPVQDLEIGAGRIRSFGKAQGQIFNVVMGDEAYRAFINNDNIDKYLDNRRISEGLISTGIMNSVGGVPKGTINSTNYMFQIWVYPEGYTNDANAFVKYMDSKAIYILPPNPVFDMGYGAIQMVLDDGMGGDAIIETEGEMQMWNFVDQKHKSWEQHVASAPLAVPVAVDQIYTAQVVA